MGARQFLVLIAAVVLAQVISAVGIAVVVVGTLAAPGPAPGPAAIDAAPLGRSFAPVLARTYADAWDAAAADVERGKPMAEVVSGFKATWQAARVKAFDARVGPEFDKVLPAGQEPKTDGERARVAAQWKSFARGLRGGK